MSATGDLMEEYYKDGIRDGVKMAYNYLIANLKPGNFEQAQRFSRIVKGLKELATTAQCSCPGCRQSLIPSEYKTKKLCSEYKKNLTKGGVSADAETGGGSLS